MNGPAAGDGGGSERLSPASQRVEDWGRESFTPSKRADTRFQRYLLSLTRFEAWMTDCFGDLGKDRVAQIDDEDSDEGRGVPGQRTCQEVRLVAESLSRFEDELPALRTDLLWIGESE